MSRTGPEYVTSESELFADLQRKQENEEISDTTAEAFIALYEFGKEIGDRVTVGGAKHANFQVKVDAHQSDSGADPSIFTANVNGSLQVWPARRPLRNDPDGESIAWEEQDYSEYTRKFQSLRGVPPGSLGEDFVTIAENGELNQFKEIVREFVSTCRQSASNSD